MSQGYTWHPILRQVPQNGSIVTTDFLAAFTDTGVNGPKRMKIQYALDQDRREDINRVARSLRHGFRFGVGIALEILTIEEQQHLVNMINRLLDTSEWTSYLSIDGGATEMEVEITDYRGPEPLKNKTRVGASFELGLRALELLQELPFISGVLAAPIVPLGLATLPTATSAYRWQIRVLEGAAGVEDISYQCLKGSGGTYSWVPIAAGG